MIYFPLLFSRHRNPLRHMRKTSLKDYLPTPLIFLMPYLMTKLLLLLLSNKLYRVSKMKVFQLKKKMMIGPMRKQISLYLQLPKISLIQSLNLQKLQSNLPFLVTLKQILQMKTVSMRVSTKKTYNQKISYNYINNYYKIIHDNQKNHNLMQKLTCLLFILLNKADYISENIILNTNMNNFIQILTHFQKE